MRNKYKAIFIKLSFLALLQGQRAAAQEADLSEGEPSLLAYVGESGEKDE